MTRTIRRGIVSAGIRRVGMSKVVLETLRETETQRVNCHHAQGGPTRCHGKPNRALRLIDSKDISFFRQKDAV
jgi:hypothetical protein